MLSDLSHNLQFEVIGALNYLARDQPDQLYACCPVLAEQNGLPEPCSFWMRRLA